MRNLGGMPTQSLGMLLCGVNRYAIYEMLY